MTPFLHSLAVVLVRPRNTLNIGAVARAMSNFGARDLRLVEVFHKDYREAPSATGPALEVLRAAREFPTLADALADTHLAVGTTGALGRAWAEQPRPLHEAAPEVRAQLAAGRVPALVFGSEKTGLSNEDLSLCHTLVRVPTRYEHASMNLGQAAAVCLYELARTPVAAEVPAPAHTVLPTAELLRLDALLHGVLTLAGYPGMDSPHRVRQLRALTRRTSLGAGDSAHWTGILRHVWLALGRGERVWKQPGQSGTP